MTLAAGFTAAIRNSAGRDNSTSFPKVSLVTCFSPDHLLAVIEQEQPATLTARSFWRFRRNPAKMNDEPELGDDH